MREDKGSQQTSNEAQALLKSMDVNVQFGVRGSHQDQAEIERSFLEIRKYFIPLFQELRAKFDDIIEIAIALAFTIYNTLESNWGVAPWDLTRPFDHLSIEKNYLMKFQRFMLRTSCNESMMLKTFCWIK